MDKNEILSLISQLENIEKQLNDGEPQDMGFVDVINETLRKLTKEINIEETSSSQFELDVNFKKLSEKAVTPSYSKIGDAGLDLTCTKVIKQTKTLIVYGTDIAIEIPLNYVGLVFPRSSIREYQLSMANCVGVIDSGYRGEIEVSFNKENLDSERKLEYNIGDRNAQLIILPYPTIRLTEVNELSDTERGKKGHGSTGN